MAAGNRLGVLGFALATLFPASLAHAQTAPAAVPIPFTADFAGTGGVGVTTCTTGIATTSGVSYGDGCAAATAGLAAPQGAAVDKYGNVYVADYTDRLVRVVYNGGANLAAAITAANSGYAISSSRSAPAPTPVVGNIYTIAGLGTTPAALTVSGTTYPCANYATSGQPVGLNSLGDGCPAASAPIGPRDVSVDGDGNLFLTDYTDSRIRVLCVNCASGTPAAALIALENPGVTPANGAMYTIAGYAGGYRDAAIGFGSATAATVAVALLRSPTAAVVSTSDDVYIADNLNNGVRLLYNGGAAAKAILNAEGITPALGYVYTIAGAGCVSAATGKTGSVVTANSCLTTAGSDMATLGNALGLNVAWTVYLDPNNNVFYSDAGNARIKVIYGGVSAPATLPNSSYATLQTGYSYSFAGQGAAITSGVPPSQILLGSPQGVGGDSNGNIFFNDYTNALFYETYAQTGIAVQIGGGNGIATPAVAAYCNGLATGPAMTDAFYDGCPLTQTKIASPRGPIVADAAGNLYFGDALGSILRKFTYNPTFPATAVSSTSAAQPYAFEFVSAQVLTAPTLFANGATASGFSDAGSDTCTNGLAVSAGAPGTTCVVNVAFAPTTVGLREGGLKLNSATAVLGTSLFSGVGLGAALAVDPGTSTTTGTGLAPNGIAVDGAGRVLVTDTTSKSLLRYTAGVASTVLSGFTAPSGVATDGAGNIFVADSSANTITKQPVIGGTKFTLTTSVSSPHGLATDGVGNLYVADTSNNRVMVFGLNATLFTVAPFTGLNAPQGVAVDASGNIYASDSTHVVKLTPGGVQTTIASGSATGIAVDAAGNVLVATGATVVEYPSGGGSAITLAASLAAPKALALDAAGDLFIADNGAAGYIELQRTAGFYQYASSPASTTIELSSIGNAPVTGSTFTQTDSTDFTLAPATTNGCSGALAAGAICALSASFNPTLPGILTDNITFSSNAANAPNTLKLTGATAAQTSSTTLGVSSSSLVYGTVETLTATVAGSLTAPASGSVNFYNNTTTLLGSGNVGGGGVATLSFVPGAGTYSVTAVFVPSGPAYYGSTSSAKGFAVTQASLTVTANNASKLYGAANPALTYTLTGFVNSDTKASAITGSPAESTSATTSSSVGSYPITVTQGTLAAANYSFSFVNGMLSITGATAQTITFAALPGVTYGVAPITLTATASSGLATGYSVTGPGTVSGSTLTITGAGMVAVTANQTGNNTYAAATPVTQSFSVAKAALTVAATPVSSVYGATLPTLAYMIAGFVNSDSQVTATIGAPVESTTAASSSSVGNYPIAIAAGTLASNNYSFAFSNGTVTITAATLTLTANNASRTYGAANPTFTGTLSGAVNGDQLTETFTSSATTASAPGTYSIVPGATGANVGNYTLAASNGTLTIAKATPTIALMSSAATGYNGTTNITLTATLASPTSGAPMGMVTFYASGVAVGTGTISGTTATFSSTTLPIGADTITATYAGDTNFATVTSTSTLVTISPGFSVTPTATALAFQQNYQEAQAYLAIAPGGRTDTLVFACQNLPAKITCAFSPASLALTGLTAAQNVQMLVSNSSAAASLETGSKPFAFAALPCALLLFVGLRRRKLPRVIAMALAALIGMAAMSGCGTSPVSLEQGSGTYNFTATVGNGTATLQTINFTLTIP